MLYTCKCCTVPPSYGTELSPYRVQNVRGKKVKLNEIELKKQNHCTCSGSRSCKIWHARTHPWNKCRCMSNRIIMDLLSLVVAHKDDRVFANESPVSARDHDIRLDLEVRRTGGDRSVEITSVNRRGIGD